MVLVRVLGKLDLFVTMTCNPNWSKIIDELEIGQSPPDCPNVVVCLFELKLRALMYKITKKNVLGETMLFVTLLNFKSVVSLMLTFFFRTPYSVFWEFGDLPK